MSFVMLPAETQAVNIDDPGPDIHEAAERHLNAVYDAEYEMEENPDADILNSPAVGPFCGCTRCVVREVLAGAWPVIETYMALRFSAPPLNKVMNP